MKNKIVIMSVYMEWNIPKEVRELHKRIIEHFAPEGCDVVQLEISSTIANINGPSITEFIENIDYEIYVILDIDAIPLNKEILPRMIKEARAGKLIGATGRNGSHHNYASSICVSFSKELWNKLGVDFCRGRRDLSPEDVEIEKKVCPWNIKEDAVGKWVESDTGEKLTYKCEELGIPVIMLKPTNVEEVIWKWLDGFFLGHRVTFEDAIWHQSETWKGIDNLLEKLKEVNEKIDNGVL